MTAIPSAPRLTLMQANLICMASMLIWAAGLPAADILIPIVPPVPLAALRLSLAAGVLLPIWWLLEGTQTLRQANWARGVVVGGVCLGMGSMLLIFAQGRTDAVTVAVISATAPVIGIAIEVALDGRRVTAALAVGLALSLAGGVMSVAGSLSDLAFGIGALAALGSVVGYTWGSRATVTAFPALTALGRTTITVCGAALVALAAACVSYAVSGVAFGPALLTPGPLAALALFGIGSIAVSQLLWIVSVGRLGIGMSSLHLNATPFYVMVFLFLLGGTWNWYQVLAALVVGLGVLIAQGVIRLPGTAP